MFHNDYIFMVDNNLQIFTMVNYGLSCLIENLMMLIAVHNG